MSPAKLRLAVLTAAAVLVSSASARATPDFPAAVDQYLMLDAGTVESVIAPPDGCHLCHVNGSQGRTPLTEFGTLMNANGATPYEAASTAGPALAAIESMEPNLIADLRKGANPNLDPSGLSSDPVPAYGCASVAPGAPTGAAALSVAFVLALAFAGRRRRGVAPAHLALGAIARALGLGALVLAAWACSDVGDSTAIPNFNALVGGDASIDANVPSSGIASDATTAMATATATGTQTGASDEAAAAGSLEDDATTGESDGAGPEASGGGSGEIDAASDAEELDAKEGEEGGGSGAAVEDAEADAAGKEAGILDSGHGDAAAQDGGEAGEADASKPDAAGEDAGAHDGGADAASGPTPCTSAPCKPSGANSVECTGNTSNVCTATEAAFVAYDIAAGHLTAGGQLSAASCYLCMLNIGGLDDNEFAGDMGNECGDITGTALDGEPATQSCVDVLTCILQTSPACATADPPATCFCGTAAGTACLTAGAANGPCLQPEINGLEVGTCTNTYPAPLSCTEGDPIKSQEAFTTATLPAGKANTIAGFAFANCASQCGL